MRSNPPFFLDFSTPLARELFANKVVCDHAATNREVLVVGALPAGAVKLLAPGGRR